MVVKFGLLPALIYNVYQNTATHFYMHYPYLLNLQSQHSQLCHRTPIKPSRFGCLQKQCTICQLPKQCTMNVLLYNFWEALRHTRQTFKMSENWPGDRTHVNRKFQLINSIIIHIYLRCGIFRLIGQECNWLD